MFRAVKYVFAVGIALLAASPCFAQVFVEKETLPIRLQAYTRGPVIDMRFLSVAEKAEMLSRFAGQRVTLVHFKKSNAEAGFHASVLPSGTIGEIIGELVFLKGGTGLVSLTEDRVSKGGLLAGGGNGRFFTSGTPDGDRQATIDGIDLIFTHSCSSEVQK